MTDAPFPQDISRHAVDMASVARDRHTAKA